MSHGEIADLVMTKYKVADRAGSQIGRYDAPSRWALRICTASGC